jgi:hypothetical protein
MGTKMVQLRAKHKTVVPAVAVTVAAQVMSP